jgi:hypothetical protein
MAPANTHNNQKFSASFFQERRLFFYEQKKQKTFDFLSAAPGLGCVA